MDYNVEFAEVDVTVVQGNDIDLTYSVTDNGVAFDLTGIRLDMNVIDVASGTSVKTWSSVGTSPAITISTSSFNILDTTGFPNAGFFRGELVNNTSDYTIAFFDFIVRQRITTLS